MEYTRQPCPIRIVEDTGCAFMMGCIGGSIFQYMKGFVNAPSGIMRSLYGGLDAAKLKAPALGGSFAIWGATFSTVECVMAHYRQREDSWNSIISGAATGGILAARSGIRSMGGNAFAGGILLLLLEGASSASAAISSMGQESYVAPTPLRWEYELDTREVKEKKVGVNSLHMSGQSDIDRPRSLLELVKLSNIF